MGVVCRGLSEGTGPTRGLAKATSLAAGHLVCSSLSFVAVLYRAKGRYSLKDVETALEAERGVVGQGPSPVSNENSNAAAESTEAGFEASIGETDDAGVNAEQGPRSARGAVFLVFTSFCHVTVGLSIGLGFAVSFGAEATVWQVGSVNVGRRTNSSRSYVGGGLTGCGPGDSSASNFISCLVCRAAGEGRGSSPVAANSAGGAVFSKAETAGSRL